MATRLESTWEPEERHEAVIRHLYFQELKLQCRYAKASFGEIQKCLNEDNKLAALAYVHFFLVLVAVISKFLFPEISSRKKYREIERISEWRGARLREILGVEPGTVLSDRAFRDHFEHLDERFDEYLLAGGGRWPRDVGPLLVSPWHVSAGRTPKKVILEGQPEGAVFPAGTKTDAHFIRHLDTSTMVLTLFDRQSIDLRKVLQEVDRLHERIVAATDGESG